MVRRVLILVIRFDPVVVDDPVHWRWDELVDTDSRQIVSVRREFRRNDLESGDLWEQAVRVTVQLDPERCKEPFGWDWPHILSISADCLDVDVPEDHPGGAAHYGDLRHVG